MHSDIMSSQVHRFTSIPPLTSFFASHGTFAIMLQMNWNFISNIAVRIRCVYVCMCMQYAAHVKISVNYDTMICYFVISFSSQVSAFSEFSSSITWCASSAFVFSASLNHLEPFNDKWVFLLVSFFSHVKIAISRKSNVSLEYTKSANENLFGRNSI